VTVVPVHIERKQGSGTYGTVNVSYSTLSPTESYPFLPSLDRSMRRADSDDYDHVSGVMTFLPGQTNASVNVSIKASNESRPESVVFLRLNYVTLVQPQQQRRGTSSCISSMGPTGRHLSLLGEGKMYKCAILCPKKLWYRRRIVLIKEKVWL